MRTMLLAAALSLPTAAAASPPASSSAQRVLAVQRMASAACGTDGGPVTCAVAVKFLGEAFALQMTQELEGKPVLCGAGRPETLTLETVFEYNDGEWSIGPADDKKRARLPPCVRDVFIPTATTRLKALWKQVHQIDLRVDVRAFYKLTLTLK